MKNKHACQEKILDRRVFLLYDGLGEKPMDELVEKTLLYDFYGELLTEHQRSVYEAVVLNDYSITEVAKDAGISRQGVHDMIKRCGKILEDYESKLHLIEKFVHIRENVDQIHELTHMEHPMDESTRMRQIEEISSDILEEL